jgi:hypothetical protein
MSPDKLRCIAQDGQILGEFFYENLTKYGRRLDGKLDRKLDEKLIKNLTKT